MVVEGSGSYGIVVSSPRIPVGDETYLDILNLEQVSKILYLEEENDQDYKKEFEQILVLMEKYSNIFNDKYFMLPIKGGLIDKFKFIENFNQNKEYGLKWLNNSKKYFNILNNLIKHNKPIYQIVFYKGEKINLSWDDFYEKMLNILDILRLSNENGFYFDDLKIENLILHNNKIKIIDFAEPINTNNSYNKIINNIINSKLNCIYYFPFNIICNILLYEYLNITKYIGGFIKNNNYHPLLYTNHLEFNQNIKYKYKIIKNFINLLKKYIPEYKTNLKLINSNLFDKLKTERTLTDFEKLYENKEITINTIYDSLKRFLILDNNLISTNKLIIEYKKYIELVFTEKEYIINFLLENINIYSFGFMYIEWVNKNINKILQSDNIKSILKKIIKIVESCCLNIICLDSQIYIVEFSNYENIINNYL